MTYGGWRQSQALGARIANIIQLRENTTSAHSSRGHQDGSGAEGGSEEGESHNHNHNHNPECPGRRRKHKIVIHSSPFLRCVQTSIAISAGIAQNPESHKVDSHSPFVKASPHSGSSHIQANQDGKSSHLSPIPEPENGVVFRRNQRRESKSHQARPLLRVDSFLGEWLSPDYFDKITPPPESKLMVASAKAELLHEEDSIETIGASTRVAVSHGNFPGGWGSPVLTSSKVKTIAEHVSLGDVQSLNEALPRLGRANSHSNGHPKKRSNLNFGKDKDQSPREENVRYVAPTPSYAISPSQPIPQGYVAHARDACVEVDYQWDSLRPPLQWGDGGCYGEEWSSMHKRFRKGLHEMISWYRYRDHNPNAMTRTLSQGLPNQQASEEQDEGEMDTVLVLVTHGAGCNALIGALTNQPVLIDVGMASLTVATRKVVGYRRVPSPSEPRHQTSPNRRRNSNFDFGISDDYDVNIIASTDHLRAGSQFLPGSQLQRSSTLPVREKSPYRYERHTFADLQHKTKLSINEDDEFRSESDRSAPTQKDSNGKSLESVSTTAKSSGGSGLWSKPLSPKLRNVAIDNHQSIRKPVPRANGAIKGSRNGLDGHTDGSPTDGVYDASKRASSAFVIDGQDRSVAPNGLWGAPPQALATERDLGSKRRWTLSQAS